MPFTDYQDMDDCIRKNADKEDPGGFCKDLEDKNESVSDEDLAKINEFTTSPLGKDDIRIFAARAITSAETSNGRVWSNEWQEANVEKFIGAPVTVNHEQALDSYKGRIYDAVYNGGETMVKFFVDVRRDKGKEAVASIEGAELYHVSIEAVGKQVTEGDHVRILPSPRDRIDAVSFVVNPGCKDCHIVETEANQADSLREFAREQVKALSDDAIRYCGFVFGPTAGKRETYRKIADSLDPFALREWVGTLKRAYGAKTKGDPATLQAINESVAQQPTDPKVSAALDYAKKLTQYK